MRRAWLADERGSMTVFGLFLTVTTLAMGGLALDVANAVRVRTELQVAADTAAHAALYTRGTADAGAAVQAALGVAASTLPAGRHGPALTEADIVFGRWDAAARQFSPDPASRSAVRVTARRSAARSNPVGTHLLRLVGFESWDIAREATFATYQPACLSEGFVAEGGIDLRSNNTYRNGFCIHSNTYVRIQQNNVFEPGTTVSMPNLADLRVPGFTGNDGLEAALREARYRLRVLDRLPGIIEALAAGNRDHLPDYVTGAAPVMINPGKLRAEDFVPGRLHIAQCGSKGSLTIPRMTLRQVVVVTNCSISFTNGATMEDALVATTSTDSQSVKGSAGLRIGRNDNCAAGGGAQILTLGGVKVAANVGFYGGQIIAAGDIDFTANGAGGQGASLIAGGAISGTSNMVMGFCNGGGTERNIRSDFYRMVG